VEREFAPGGAHGVSKCSFSRPENQDRAHTRPPPNLGSEVSPSEECGNLKPTVIARCVFPSADFFRRSRKYRSPSSPNHALG